MRTTILVLLALVLSVYIGYSDLHQTDTPITVIMILVASCIVGFIAGKRPWIYAIIIGVGVPIVGLLAAYFHWQLSGVEHGQIKTWYTTYDNAGISVVTVALAFAGVYLGQGIKKLFQPIKVY